MNPQDIEAKLNQFRPCDVREAFLDIAEHPLRGPETSERGCTGTVNAATAKPGARIVAALGKVFVRVTVLEGGAAAFTEYEMTPTSFQGLAAALLAKLVPSAKVTPFLFLVDKSSRTISEGLHLNFQIVREQRGDGSSRVHHVELVGRADEVRAERLLTLVDVSAEGVH